MADSETGHPDIAQPEVDPETEAELDPAQLSAEAMRRQSRQHPRRRSSKQRNRSKRKKTLKRVLLIVGQVVFLLAVVYTWYKVSSAIQ